jgi:hypothetical protein
MPSDCVVLTDCYVIETNSIWCQDKFELHLLFQHEHTKGIISMFYLFTFKRDIVFLITALFSFTILHVSALV